MADPEQEAQGKEDSLEEIDFGFLEIPESIKWMNREFGSKVGITLVCSTWEKITEAGLSVESLRVRLDAIAADWSQNNNVPGMGEIVRKLRGDYAERLREIKRLRDDMLLQEIMLLLRLQCDKGKEDSDRYFSNRQDIGSVEARLLDLQGTRSINPEGVIKFQLDDQIKNLKEERDNLISRGKDLMRQSNDHIKNSYDDMIKLIAYLNGVDPEDSSVLDLGDALDLLLTYTHRDLHQIFLYAKIEIEIALKRYMGGDTDIPDMAGSVYELLLKLNPVYQEQRRLFRT